MLDDGGGLWGWFEDESISCQQGGKEGIDEN